MNVFRQRINCLYADGVAEVRAAGVELSPADYAWLWDLSRAAVDLGRDVPEILSLPVMVGDVELRPVTVRATLWLLMAGEWFADGPETVLALAWMLNHSDDERAIKSACTKFRARAAVWMWAATLPISATIERLAHGVSVAMGGRDGSFVDLPSPGYVEKSERPSVSDYGKFIIRICAKLHMKPEDVMKMPASDAYALGRIGKDGAVRDESGSGEYLAYRAAIDHLKSGGKNRP